MDSGSDLPHVFMEGDTSSSSSVESISPVANLRIDSPSPAGRENIRDQWNTLIEDHQEYEGREGLELHGAAEERMLISSIQKGRQLVDKLGGDPGSRLLAATHTRLCCSMFKLRTGNMGSNTSAFNMGLVIHNLLKKSRSADDAPKRLGKSISLLAKDCATTLDPMVVVMVGAFERQSIATSGEAKEKKPRTVARRRQFEDTTAFKPNHHEIVKAGDRQSCPQTNLEAYSKQILKVLKGNCLHSAQQAVNIFEFALDTASLSKTIESLFFVSFLVRDGEVRLFRAPEQPNHDYTISIKPDTPPDTSMGQPEIGQKKKKKRKAPRQQFILSFSGKRWKELRGMASGQNMITEHVEEEEGGESQLM